jgi:conjugal transfer pilus assembly protein TraF
MQPQHVTWYYYLQDFARRRARAFMNVTDVVMLENPSLNLNTVYSESPPGQEARRAEYERSISDRLDEERQSAGLVFLVRKGCPYCEAQRTELKYFQQRHGWEIKEVDIGENPQAGARFGVEYTPTTIVVFRGTDQWMPVSVGVDTVPTIEEGLYKALRLMHGETTPEQYDLHEYEDGGPYDPNRARLR